MINPIVSSFGATSTFYGSHYSGDLCAYARAVLSEVRSGSPAISLLRAESVPAIYDGFGALHHQLTTADHKQSRGQYMTRFALAEVIGSMIPCGRRVLDPACGVGSLLAALPRDFTGHRCGLELSGTLVLLGRAAQALAFPSEASWCHRADILGVVESQHSDGFDALVMSPPWILRDDIPSEQVAALARLPAFSNVLSHPLFDMCVPCVTLAIHRHLAEGGHFIATVPSRIATAPEWAPFRSGELHRSFGLDVDQTFEPSPPWARDAYPVPFVFAVGTLRARRAR